VTPRENLLNLLRRQGYEAVPVRFDLCHSLQWEFKNRYGTSRAYEELFSFPFRYIAAALAKSDCDWRIYYSDLKEGTVFDSWGVAHEPGSAEAKHMLRMHHPLESCSSLNTMGEYPFPDYSGLDLNAITQQVNSMHKRGLAAVAQMEATIWERAWYLRGMLPLMVDMQTDNEKAEWLLDKVTQQACIKAENFAKAGTDIIFIGDDIGMQNSLMMSEQMYRKWLKQRLSKVISHAKSVKSDILIHYHSCGFVFPLISDLIETGIDILNPVQPERMDFEELHKQFGACLSFSGTIGTQSTMPFGSPDDVRQLTNKNLRIAGKKGGLLCSPTHLLEPEVTWDNIEAYVQACQEYKHY